jgi:transcriptional regulator with XRE-family HTH domain
VRQRRRALGMKLRDVSDKTGLSVPFLSQIENELAQPSLTSLFALAAVLDTTPERLLCGPQDGAVVLVRADEGTTYAVTDAPSTGERRQLTAPGEPFASAEYVVTSGADLGGFHASTGREMLHVTVGRLAVDLQDEMGDVVTHELGAGDTLLYATSTHHRWRQVGRATTRFLHVVSPA